MKLQLVDTAAMSEKGIPEYMQDAIIAYYEVGRPPGDFLCAVINNDLRGAVSHADDTNKLHLHSYMLWFYNHAPAGTWGFEGAVDKWVKEFKHEQAD